MRNRNRLALVSVACGLFLLTSKSIAPTGAGPMLPKPKVTTQTSASVQPVQKSPEPGMKPAPKSAEPCHIPTSTTTLATPPVHADDLAKVPEVGLTNAPSELDSVIRNLKKQVETAGIDTSDPKKLARLLGISPMGPKERKL